MGTFTHPITLYSGSGDASETLDALVDTDTLLAVVPRSILERLEVAVDEVRGRAIGHVQAELHDHRLTIMSIFGTDEEYPRIGRHTLDTFLLEADFEKRQLVPKTFRLIQHF